MNKSVLNILDDELQELSMWMHLSGPDSVAAAKFEELGDARATVEQFIQSVEYLMPRILSTNGANAVDRVEIMLAAMQGRQPSPVRWIDRCKRD